ncbi:MAG: DUF3237 domain-containing protein [Solirubrobacterales bacterium]|nr:DUF3237 domain-containing protein [Solirubrobacterales bacterium]
MEFRYNEGAADLPPRGGLVGATKSAVDVGLEFEFEYHAMLKPPVEIGPCPYGTRRFYEAVGGEVTGERISGRVLSGGGDWILIGPDGWGRLDVRAQIQTADNALIFMSYFGVFERNDAVRRATETGGGTDYEEHYFRTAPRLETGDARYAWLNQTLFVAQGRIYPGGDVQYRVFRVT